MGADYQHISAKLGLVNYSVNNNDNTYRARQCINIGKIKLVMYLILPKTYKGINLFNTFST